MGPRLRQRTRQLALLTAAMVCVGLTACGNGADTPEPAPTTTTTSHAATSSENWSIPVDRARSVADQMNDRSATLTTP